MSRDEGVALGVCRDRVLVIIQDLQQGFINNPFIKRCSKGLSVDVEFVLETIGIHS